MAFIVLVSSSQVPESGPLIRSAEKLNPCPLANESASNAGAVSDPSRRAVVGDRQPLFHPAVVIFNLIKPGSEAQRRADRSYSRKMLSGMAEGGYGPMHMGRAVTVEGDADFDQFVAVYYPGIDFVQRMIGSIFMSRIGGDKQLGDSLAVITVPIPAG